MKAYTHVGLYTHVLRVERVSCFAAFLQSFDVFVKCVLCAYYFFVCFRMCRGLCFVCLVMCTRARVRVPSIRSHHAHLSATA